MTVAFLSIYVNSRDHDGDRIVTTLLQRAEYTHQDYAAQFVEYFHKSVIARSR